MIFNEDVYYDLESACSGCRWWMETDYMDRHFIVNTIIEIKNDPQFLHDPRNYKLLVDQIFPVGDEDQYIGEYVKCFFKITHALLR